MEEPDRVPEFDPVVKLFQVQKKSLEWGDMLGIFSVAVALMLIMMLLTKLFPTKKEENQPEDGERS